MDYWNLQSPSNQLAEMFTNTRFLFTVEPLPRLWVNTLNRLYPFMYALQLLTGNRITIFSYLGNLPQDGFNLSVGLSLDPLGTWVASGSSHDGSIMVLAYFSPYRYL